MPPRKARKAPATSTPSPDAMEVDPSQSQNQKPEQNGLAPPAQKGRKRTASQSRSPTPPTTQPATTEEEGSQPDSQESGHTDGSGSVTKKARIAKERALPTRVSKRAATKANTRALAVKENGGVPPAKGAKAKAPAVPKATRAPKAPKAPLPIVNTPPERIRPARQLFVFGTGEFGQFGLGTDALASIKRPRLHAWCDEAVQDGILGDEAGAGIESLAVGGMHNLMVDEVGRVWSWGINDNAALGRITTGHTNPETGEVVDSDEFESKPMIVQKLVDEKFRAVHVAAGDSVSVAISDVGQLRAWGSFRSSEGVLGFDGQIGSSKLQYSPIIPHNLEKEHFISAACGADHVVAVTNEGKVWCWGDPRQGAIGRKVNERHVINALRPGALGLKDIKYVASGNWHSFAVDGQGVVLAWGLNSMGQLGLASNEYFDTEDQAPEAIETHVAAPLEVESLNPKNLGGRRVVQISGGEHHTLFLLSDGSVFACGRNDSGQLGLPADHPALIKFQAVKTLHPEETLDCIPYPVQVYFPPTPPPGATGEEADPPLGSFQEASAPAADGGPRTAIQHISAGTRNNLAVSKDGIVYSWGLGNQYQLGMGEVDEKSVPGRVKSAAMVPFDFESCYAGGQHCLLIACRRKAPAS